MTKPRAAGLKAAEELVASFTRIARAVDSAAPAPQQLPGLSARFCIRRRVLVRKDELPRRSSRTSSTPRSSAWPRPPSRRFFYFEIKRLRTPKKINRRFTCKVGEMSEGGRAAHVSTYLNMPSQTERALRAAKNRHELKYTHLNGESGHWQKEHFGIMRFSPTIDSDMAIPTTSRLTLFGLALLLADSCMDKVLALVRANRRMFADTSQLDALSADQLDMLFGVGEFATAVDWRLADTIPLSTVLCHLLSHVVGTNIWEHIIIKGGDASGIQKLPPTLLIVDDYDDTLGKLLADEMTPTMRQQPLTLVSLLRLRALVNFAVNRVLPDADYCDIVFSAEDPVRMWRPVNSCKFVGSIVCHRGKKRYTSKYLLASWKHFVSCAAALDDFRVVAEFFERLERQVISSVLAKGDHMEAQFFLDLAGPGRRWQVQVSLWPEANAVEDIEEFVRNEWIQTNFCISVRQAPSWFCVLDLFEREIVLLKYN